MTTEARPQDDDRTKQKAIAIYMQSGTYLSSSSINSHITALTYTIVTLALAAAITVVFGVSIGIVIGLIGVFAVQANLSQQMQTIGTKVSENKENLEKAYEE